MRLPLAVVLLVFPLVTPYSGHAATPGDPNDDGRISVADGVQTMRAANGLSSLCALESCDVDASGSLTVTDGVYVYREAIGLDPTAASEARSPRAATTPVNVHFTFNATAALQGFQVEVTYPLGKGGFTGSADSVACSSNGAGFFVANDRDDGTMAFIQANVVALTFPIDVTCQFDQLTGQTLASADVGVTVVEVVENGAPGDPANLLVDVSVGDPPTTPCGTGSIQIGTREGGVLDAGWTGIAHGAPVPAQSLAILPLDCSGGSSTCDIAGAGVADQPAGAPLPLSAGGVSVCVLNTFREAVTGTFDCDSGCTQASVKLLARVFLVQEAGMPCPPCVGDPVPNDGLKGGTCIGGTTPDAACDANGVTAAFEAVGAGFGTTSLDCLPTGSSVGELAVDLEPLTTGTASRTASVDCLSTAFPPGSCYCPNQVQPNACIPNGVCPASGVCEHGPIDGICSQQHLRQCRSDMGTADCEDIFPGAGTCIDVPRPCFGDTITRTGSCGIDDGTLTAVFCLAQTRAAAINVTYGLPGPAALHLPIRVDPPGTIPPAPTFTPSPSPTIVPSPVPLGCTAFPRAGCRGPASGHTARLLVNDGSAGRKEIAWRQLGSEATPADALGNPAGLTSYAFCTYQDGQLVLDVPITAGGACGRAPCWHARRGRRYVYRDASGRAGGINRIDLTPGDDGAARFVVQGRGAEITLRGLPLLPPVIVQLQNLLGECWEATFDASTVQRNDGTRFRATLRR